MPGFMVSHGGLPRSMTERQGVKRLFLPDGGAAAADFLPKFPDDKAFTWQNGCCVVLDGYLLNRRALCERYGADSAADLILRLYGLKGEDFFAEFRGCFSGALYDGRVGKWIVFTNHIGDAALFYCCAGGSFVAGSRIEDVLAWCRDRGVALTYNESCAYQMLTYGFVATDETYANEIRRLHGGDYLVWQDGRLAVNTYHRFVKRPERFAHRTEAEIIEAVDAAFRDAVGQEWAKDDEYGYRHLADLSGGLDSRMNLWVAHEQQKRTARVLTYCKAGYLDETVARQIASFWDDEMIFHPLDDASFLYDIDGNTAMLGGLSLYSAITGGGRLLASLDLSAFGLEHTGMVGDAALGSFFTDPGDSHKKRPSGMYSEKLRDRLTERVKRLYEAYFDYEIFLMYVRGFHGACNTHLLRRYYTEVATPFLNVEFLQLCYDIPMELRIGHRIYKKWIVRKHPKAARFVWEKTGGRITESPLRTKLRRLVKKGPKKLLRLLGGDARIRTGMNPLDYWISRDPKIRAYMDAYEAAGYRCLPEGASPRLIDDMKALYRTGNASEKAMVLTVLAAAKLYFGARDAWAN